MTQSQSSKTCTSRRQSSRQLRMWSLVTNELGRVRPQQPKRGSQANRNSVRGLVRLQPRTRPQWLGLCIDVGYVSNTNLLWESGEALFKVLGDIC
jgi:hypothetical protein